MRLYHIAERVVVYGWRNV